MPLNTEVDYNNVVIKGTVELGVKGERGRQGPPVPVAQVLGDDPELAVSQKLLTDSIADMEQGNSTAVQEATRQAGLAEDSATTAAEQAGIATTKAGEAYLSAQAAADSEDSAEQAAITANEQAGIATTKAGEADLSAQSASRSASASSQSEQGSQAAQGLAEQAKDDAVIAQDASEDAASASALSAQAASGSAGIATTKASEASDSEVEATRQAGLAADSEAAAGQAATIATTKAGESSQSAQSAAQSALDAHDLLDEVNDKLDGKFDKADVTQETGQSTEKVMSQKAVTDALIAMLPSVNDIGTPGSIGYGVGICPEIPAGYTAMTGAHILGNVNYGNYQYSDGSIMVWIPAYYARIAHPSNPTYDKHGVNSIHTEPLSAFATRAAAEANGFMLPRAFIDGGEVMPGFMHDKYRCSNNSGVASSIKNGKPLSSHSTHNPFSELNGQPSNNYAGAIDAAKTRGEQFFPASLFMRATLATLAEAHAQATTSHSHNKWWDPDGVTNFIKGCNNNALGDTNDPDVTYEPDGFQNCGRAGSGQPFAKTTHNGQNCGIADLNGNMYTIKLGLTCVAESKSITGATQTNPAQLTIDAHGLSADDQLMVYSVAGMTELNAKIYLVDIVDENTVSLRGVDATEFKPYESGGTATAGTFYVASENAKMEDFTGGNTLETDHWGSTGVAANMEPIKLNFATDYPNNGVVQRFGNGPSQVLSEAVAGEDWLRSSLGMPKSDGISISGSSLFGNDYHYQYIRNELCVLSGLYWGSGSHAGPWAVSLLHYRTSSNYYVGFASACYPVRPSS